MLLSLLVFNVLKCYCIIVNPALADAIDTQDVKAVRYRQIVCCCDADRKAYKIRGCLQECYRKTTIKIRVFAA